MSTIYQPASFYEETGTSLSDISGEPIGLVGRYVELHRIIDILKKDLDMHITGAPGSGRFSLIRSAAHAVNAKILSVDCIRASNGESFIQLLLDSLCESFEEEYIFITQVLIDTEPDKEIFIPFKSKISLAPNLSEDTLWKAFQTVINGIQTIAEKVGGRAILIMDRFSYIYSWDKKRKWENFLRSTIDEDEKVSYAILGTVAEEHLKRSDNHNKDKEYRAPHLVELKPLPALVIFDWAKAILHSKGLEFDIDEESDKLFLSVVEGHIGEAETLLRRIILLSKPGEKIKKNHVNNALKSIRHDFSTIFETVLFMLPYTQIQLLECFATDPTSKPHQKSYIDKHGLSKGGTLQAALKGLQQRGLIYGAEFSYRLTLPLFAYWIRTQKGVRLT